MSIFIICLLIISAALVAVFAVLEVRLALVLLPFYPRDTMHVQVLAVALCLSVCVSLSQVSILSKWLNELSWSLARERLSARPTLCTKR